MDELQSHVQKVPSYLEELLHACKGGAEEGWETVSIKKDVTIGKLSIPNSSLNCMRGQGTIRANLEDIWKVMTADIQNIKLWDAMFIDGERILTQDAEDARSLFCIASLKFRAPTSLVYPRDFCCFSALKKLEDGFVYIHMFLYAQADISKGLCRLFYLHREQSLSATEGIRSR